MLPNYSINHNDISIVKPAYLWRYFNVVSIVMNVIDVIRHSVTIANITVVHIWTDVQADVWTIAWALAFFIIVMNINVCAWYLHTLFTSWWCERVTLNVIGCTADPLFCTIFSDARDQQCKIMVKKCSIEYGFHFSKSKRSKSFAKIFNVQISFLKERRKKNSHINYVLFFISLKKHVSARKKNELLWFADTILTWFGI